MSQFIIQQQCPFPGCEETLTFTVSQVIRSEDANDSLRITMRAETTPESTEHAYSHQETK